MINFISPLVHKVISTVFSGERSGAVHRRCHAGHGREAGRQRHGPLAELVSQPQLVQYSYGHLLIITGYFYGIIHSINGVLLVLITGKWP